MTETENNSELSEGESFIKNVSINFFVAMLIVFPATFICFLGGSILVSYNVSKSKPTKMFYFALGFALNILVLFWYMYMCMIKKSPLPEGSKAFDI